MKKILPRFLKIGDCFKTAINSEKVYKLVDKLPGMLVVDDGIFIQKLFSLKIAYLLENEKPKIENTKTERKERKLSISELIHKNEIGKLYDLIKKISLDVNVCIEGNPKALIIYSTEICCLRVFYYMIKEGEDPNNLKLDFYPKIGKYGLSKIV